MGLKVLGQVDIKKSSPKLISLNILSGAGTKKPNSLKTVEGAGIKRLL